MCYLSVANICANDWLRKFILSGRGRSKIGESVTGVGEIRIILPMKPVSMYEEFIFLFFVRFPAKPFPDILE
jgi:hypothetical protein